LSLPSPWWLLPIPLLWLGLRRLERTNLYFPNRNMEGDPSLLQLGFEDLRLTAADGTTIHAWYIPLRPDSPVVLFCHGNGGNISHRLDKLLLLRRAGASVLLFDYRGYGRSSGRPDEEGTYQDAEAAYRWLSEVKQVPPARIVAHGESLGGAVALELALRRRVGGLVLDSAFTSVIEMGQRLFPFLPVALVARFRYDNLAKAHRLSCPVLLMHSPQDDIVPYDMGRRLFAALPQPKTFCELTGSHNEGFLESAAVYERAITGFLAGRREAP